MSNFKYSKDRFGKILLYIFVDIIIIAFSILAGTSLWYYGGIPGSTFYGIPTNVISWLYTITFVGPILGVIIYSLFHMYNNLWKYANIDEMYKIFVSTTILYVMIFVESLVYFGKTNVGISKRMLFVSWTLTVVLFTMSRFGYRMIKRILIYISHILSSKAGCKRVLVIGAGFSGYGVVKEMLSSKIRDAMPVLVIDSDHNKMNTNILGIRVIDSIDRIEEMVEKYQIDEIIITIDGEDNKELKKVLEQCNRTKCILKIINSYIDISDGDNVVKKLRDVNISDLLFRDEVELNIKGITDYIKDKTVLVTGGGGSIGSEICRQICKYNPSTLIIFDIYENNAFELYNQLKNIYKDKINIFLRIGSVRDIIRLEEIFKKYNPNLVFHAAAHKHVTLMEENPAEAVKNNVFGTLNTIKMADKYKVESFVVLSSDKAVNPTNIMGATKRISECLVQIASKNSETSFSAVRFGNVLGSNGSVVPLFKKQIEEGGPVTITHNEIERYFMTIKEAVQLVLQSGQLNKTGRIMVLDMGEPVKIIDIAKNLIKLSGYTPYEDIDLQIIGLRNGEKMFEELLMEEEKNSLEITEHKKISIVKLVDMNEEIFKNNLDKLNNASFYEIEKVEEIIKELVPNYNSTKY